MKGKKMLIFHDFLIEKGGGERVILTLSQFLDCIIFTSMYKKESTFTFPKTSRIFSSSSPFITLPMRRALKLLHTIIFFKKILPNFKKFFDRNFSFALFSGFYSILLAPHITLFKAYYIQSEPLKCVFQREYYRRARFLAYKILHKLFIKKIEKNSIQNMDLLVANSYYIANVFEKEFKVNINEVIYPPVDVRTFYFKNFGDFFLSVGRLYPHKRIHVVANIFTKIPEEKLVIVGDGPLKGYITRLSEKYNNITYLGSVSERKIRELYATCKCAIYIPEKEHFGLVPIEANASGKPVIVCNEGAFPETIIDGETGIILSEPIRKNLFDVIKNFKNFEFDKRKCRKNAYRFDVAKFIKKMKTVFGIG